MAVKTADPLEQYVMLFYFELPLAVRIVVRSVVNLFQILYGGSCGYMVCFRILVMKRKIRF